MTKMTMPYVRLTSKSTKLYFAAKYFVLISGVILIFCTSGHLWYDLAQFRDNNYTTHITEVLGPEHNVKVHSRGFWSGSDAKAYHAHNHAAGLSKRLIKFFTIEGAKSVIDLGGGNGHQIKNLIRNGIFASCYDGNPNAQEISDGICGTVDLTKPLNLAQYDWVLSLSVGRQIPPIYKKDFIANIDRVNKRGVVIYWGDGKPGRPDLSNSVLDNSQVIQIFTNSGYTNDIIAQNYLRGHAPPKNYSILVFRKNKTKVTQSLARKEKPLVNLAVVSCGMEKLEEAVTMIKSAILFSHGSKLQLYGFTDKETLPKFTKYMDFLRKESVEASGDSDFDYELKLASFPEELEGMPSWVRMIKPCSLEMLFSPSVLPNVDSVIYMDADTLILSNLTHTWNRFQYFNSSQFIGLSSAIPGEPAFESWIDNKEFVYPLPCEWNLRYEHCTCGVYEVCEECTSGIANGIAVIHGTNGAFTNRTRLPLFNHIYEYFKTFSIKTDNLISLTAKLLNQFNFEENLCSFDTSNNFYKRMTNYVNNLVE